MPRPLHRIASSDSTTIAAFDFDRTLTWVDTVVPFLIRACGPVSVSKAILEAWRPGTLLQFPRRDIVKARLVEQLFRGREAEELRRIGHKFADEVLPKLLRTQVLERFEEHKALGHQVVLVSASFDFYLCRIGERLGADAVLCTEVEVGTDGRCTGRLLRGNCRGEQKIMRLREWAGDKPYVLHAYGDSKGDAALLGAADFASWIGRPPRTTRVP